MNSYYTLNSLPFFVHQMWEFTLLLFTLTQIELFKVTNTQSTLLKFCLYTFKAFNKGLTKAYRKYGKIHLYFNISEFSDNLFSTRNGCCSDFSTKQDVCKLYVVSEWLLSVSVFCFALSPVPSYFFR